MICDKLRYFCASSAKLSAFPVIIDLVKAQRQPESVRVKHSRSPSECPAPRFSNAAADCSSPAEKTETWPRFSRRRPISSPHARPPAFPRTWCRSRARTRVSRRWPQSKAGRNLRPLPPASGFPRTGYGRESNGRTSERTQWLSRHRLRGDCTTD